MSAALAPMLVEPVTRIITPSGPSVAGGALSTPPTSYLPVPSDITPPLSEAAVPAVGVYDAVPSVTSPPVTVSSGPLQSHVSWRLAAPVAAPVAPVVSGPVVSGPVVSPMVSGPLVSPPVVTGPMVSGLGSSAFAPPSYNLGTAPALPAPFNPFTQEFHFTVEPRESSPGRRAAETPILNERRSIFEASPRRVQTGKLSDMATDVERLSQGLAVLAAGLLVSGAFNSWVQKNEHITYQSLTIEEMHTRFLHTRFWTLISCVHGNRLFVGHALRCTPNFDATLADKNHKDNS